MYFIRRHVYRHKPNHWGRRLWHRGKSRRKMEVGSRGRQEKKQGGGPGMD